MPCFNAAATLDQAIASILRQTLEELELVAVDDGSQDETARRLKSWSESDERLRVISIPHAGIVEALNVGLAACRAPLIARMDADDQSLPTRLEKQMAFLEANPDIAVASCLVRGFPENHVAEGYRIYFDWLNDLITPEAIAREIYIESPLAHPSVVMRRTWIERVGGYQDNGWAEDYDLWHRMHLAGARFAKVPVELVRIREHPARLTRTDRRYSVENFLRAKARYLVKGPLEGREAVIMWGAGQMGRRLSKHLLRHGAPLVAFVDIDPAKIGRTRRGFPIIAPADLRSWWERFDHPVLLSAVASRGARALIREQLTDTGLVEAVDWWAVA